jgi:hypothetical protein
MVSSTGAARSSGPKLETDQQKIPKPESFGIFILSPDHGQQHLEFLQSPDGVRFVGWHDDHLARPNLGDLTRNNNLSLALQYMNQRIERRRMLTQFLALIEGEQGQVTGLSFEQHPADD